VNGFVHWDDVALLEGMWQGALANAPQPAHSVRILHGSVREAVHLGASVGIASSSSLPRHQTIVKRPDHGAGGHRDDRVWEPVLANGPSGGCGAGFGGLKQEGACDRGTDSDAGCQEEWGFIPSFPAAFPSDPLLESVDSWRDACRLGEAFQTDAVDDFFADPCAWPPEVESKGSVGWCGEAGFVENQAAAAAGPMHGVIHGAGSAPLPQRSSYVFENQFVSLRVEVVCLKYRGGDGKQVGMVLAPVDTASSWLLGGDVASSAIGGRVGSVAVGRSGSTSVAGAGGAVSLGDAMKAQEDGACEEPDLASTMAAVSGVYRVDWDRFLPNGITPGDVRQFLSDLVVTSTAPASGNIVVDSLEMGMGDSSRALSSLFQTVVNVTGAMSNWSVKTAINMLSKYADFHVSFDDDGTGVPNITLHMRASFFGVYRTAWSTVSHLRLDGHSFEKLSATSVPCGLRMVASLTKSVAESLTISSFWLAPRPCRAMRAATCADAEARSRGQHRAVFGGNSSRTRGGEGVDCCEPPAAALGAGAGGANGKAPQAASACEPSKAASASASAWSMAASGSSGSSTSDLAGWYVQHMRHVHLDQRTQSIRVNGFLPGMGTYAFHLNKIGPLDNAILGVAAPADHSLMR